MVSKEQIANIINTIIKEKTQLTEKCSIIKSTFFYNEAVRVAEKYGLRLKRCTRKELRFEYEHEVQNPLNKDITSTELRFDDMLSNSWINMLDGEDYLDEGVYSLDTILGYYDSMPEQLKRGSSLINFDDTADANYSLVYDPRFHKENVVHITLQAFGPFHTETHNLERIMAHELGHCFEMGKITPQEKRLVKKLLQGDYNLSDKEQRLFQSVIYKTNNYSRDGGVFANAVEEEASDKFVNVDSVIQSTYAKDYYYKFFQSPSRLSEHFAETVSIMSFRDKNDKSNATLYRGESVPTQVTYNEYVLEGGQDKSIPVVEDLLFGNSKGYDIEYVEYE